MYTYIHVLYIYCLFDKVDTITPRDCYSVECVEDSESVWTITVIVQSTISVSVQSHYSLDGSVIVV